MWLAATSQTNATNNTTAATHSRSSVRARATARTRTTIASATAASAPGRVSPSDLAQNLCGNVRLFCDGEDDLLVFT